MRLVLLTGLAAIGVATVMPVRPALALVDFNAPTYQASDLTFADDVFPLLDGQDGGQCLDWQF
ncbi:MAG: hypothetical protein R3C45_04855 [Phycisphaerales bacterium]